MTQNINAEKIQESLAEAGLVLPGPAEKLLEGFQPTVDLQVSYAGNSVELGTSLPANECRVEPAISFAPEGGDIGSRASYTIMLVDCDAASPKTGFYRHWVEPGLTPLSPNSENIVASTKYPLTPYLGPQVKEGSKPHRCLFLLYREPPNLDMSKDDLGGDEAEQRLHFQPSVFAEKHGLTLVGVNWMTCTAD